MKQVMKPVTQEQSMGCAVACVASLLRISYSKVLEFFKKSKAASSVGYYCRDICQALQKAGKKYQYQHVSPKNKRFLSKTGVIVFIKKSKQYPLGHYLLRTAKGWMNPWINYPHIKPAKAGIQKRLPGKAQWVIFPKETL